MREWVDRAKKCKEERKVEEKRQSHGQQNYNAQNSTPPHHTTPHSTTCTHSEYVLLQRVVPSSAVPQPGERQHQSTRISERVP
jgi:hypothetical protein